MKHIKTRARDFKAITIPKFIPLYYSSDPHHLEEGVQFPQEEEARLHEEGAEAEVAQGTYNCSNKEINNYERTKKEVTMYVNSSNKK